MQRVGLHRPLIISILCIRLDHRWVNLLGKVLERIWRGRTDQAVGGLNREFQWRAISAAWRVAQREVKSVLGQNRVIRPRQARMSRDHVRHNILIVVPSAFITS